MHMIMKQEDKIRTPTFQFQRLFTCLMSRSKAILALKAASVLFVLILWCFTEEFSGFPSLNLGRTHMFLICNGIVLILVKGSVLAPPNEGAGDQQIRTNHVQKVEMGCELIIGGKHVTRDEIVLGVQEEEEEVEMKTNGYVSIAEPQEIDQQLVEIVEYEDKEDGLGSFQEELSMMSSSCG